MTGRNAPQGGLTRRSFLKAAGVAVGAVGLAGAANMTATDGWLAPAKAHAEADQYTVCTTHQSHCSGHCSLQCTVRDGRLALVEPNEAWSDERFSTCCLKGISEVQHIYSTERLQTPLKRVGERGSGDFCQISWDEALDEIAAKLTEIKAEYGPESILVKRAKEANYSFLTSILGALSDRNTGIDTGIGNGLDPATGIGGGFASNTNEDLDWVNSKTIIHMGNNLLESKLVTARAFFDAKDAGARMIVIDPNFSTTAGKSDQWIPIQPGTDAALLLAMVNLVIDREWHDADFMRRYTSFPYLVDEETGQLLRQGGDPEGALLVWDAQRSMAVPYTEVVESALEGHVDVEGKRAEPVFSRLKREVEECTPAWAAGITGIDPATIEELTRAYVHDGPASLSLGYGGGDKYENADIVGHAAIVLASLVGQIGKPGASIGVFGGGTGAPSASLASWPLPKEFSPSKQRKSLSEQRSTDEIRAVFAPCDIYLQSFANAAQTERWLKQLDLVVVAEIYHTTFVDWADYVLPVCSRFESEDNIAGVSTAQGHVRLQQKVLDPLFESRSDFYIERALVERLGHGDLLPRTREEYAIFQLEESKDEALAGMTIAALKEAGGVLPIPGTSRPVCLNLDKGLKTDSERLDVYYEDMLPWNQALPRYEEPNEAFKDNPLRDRYPLDFLQTRTRFHIHNHFCDAEWIRQFVDAFVEMNPKDMADRGLVTGNIVKVFNDRGSASCRVQANEAVRPGTVRSFEGTWSKYMDAGNFQSLTNDAVLPRGKDLMKGPVIPFNDTLVQVEKA